MFAKFGVVKAKRDFKIEQVFPLEEPNLAYLTVMKFEGG